MIDKIKEKIDEDKKDKETIQNRAKDHNCELVFC